jgi:hypothetical protein
MHLDRGLQLSLQQWNLQPKRCQFETRLDQANKPRKIVMKLVLVVLLMFSGYTFAASCANINDLHATR